MIKKNSLKKTLKLEHTIHLPSNTFAIVNCTINQNPGNVQRLKCGRRAKHTLIKYTVYNVESTLYTSCFVLSCCKTDSSAYNTYSNTR